jgi:regulator of cell morphogenesis and NO signaling
MDSTKLVGEIVAANPAAARVFETLGIDYCCGGKLSLGAACANAKVTVETVAGLMDACREPSGAGAPVDATLRDLTHYIVERHHAFVRREGPRIRGLLAKICDKHGVAHPELSDVKNLFFSLDQELAEHMRKEEQILFPYIDALEGAFETPACFASVVSPIDAMIADHENAGAILSAIRARTNGYKAPENGCATFRAAYRALEDFERDLHWHVHLENNILFPRAIAAERERRSIRSLPQ